MSIIVEEIVINLFISYVGYGGNTGEGKYFFAYTPEFVPIKTENTPMRFIIDESCRQRFAIYDYACCDPTRQMVDIKLSADYFELTMINRCNELHQLILFSILVTDKAAESGLVIINCDPQVTNVIPPTNLISN
ncbi:MAG: hypothetical protein Tsb002_14640 [Wenzhouxiangellaceae bacterium]